MHNRVYTSYFRKKVNLFTKLVYKQIAEALQSFLSNYEASLQGLVT